MNLKNRILFKLTEKILLRNKRFKGIHEGESCYLFGNAKSLKYYDLSLFNDRVSIGCNGLFFHKDFSKIGLSYYFNGDPFYMYPYWRNIYTARIERHILGDLFKKKISENKSINYFLNISDSPISRGENIFYAHHFGQQFNGYKNCRLDGAFSANQNALSGMIGLAIYMGFKDITLVGCDHLMKPKTSEHFYEYGRLDQDHSPSIINEKVIKSAQTFLKIRVLIPNDLYKGHIIPHIQYEELTGKAPHFKENYEIISDADFKILRQNNCGYSITEKEFRENNEWRLRESKHKYSIEE